MGEIIKAIIDFFTNKGLHIGYRLSLAISIFLGLLFLNDFLGFTRSYILNSRLDQIIKLKEIDPDILKDDSIVNQRYLRIKTEIINDQSKSEEAIRYLKRVAIHFESKNSNSTIKQKDVQKEIAKSNSFWLDFSSMAYFYLIIALIIAGILANVFNKKSKEEKLPMVVAGIIVIIITYFIGKLYQFIVSFLPFIPGLEWINYLLYFLTPTVLTFAIIIYARFRSKKKRLNNLKNAANI